MFDEISEHLHDLLERGEITEEQWKERMRSLDEEDF